MLLVSSNFLTSPVQIAIKMQHQCHPYISPNFETRHQCKFYKRACQEPPSEQIFKVFPDLSAGFLLLPWGLSYWHFLNPQHQEAPARWLPPYLLLFLLAQFTSFSPSTISFHTDSVLHFSHDTMSGRSKSRCCSDMQKVNK